MKIKLACITLVAATAIFAGGFASANSKPPQIQPPIAEKPASNDKLTKKGRGEPNNCGVVADAWYRNTCRNPRTGGAHQALLQAQQRKSDKAKRKAGGIALPAYEDYMK